MADTDPRGFACHTGEPPPSPTPGTRRRGRILVAARKLFVSRGPSKTKVADIAREADIAVGSVYLEFASKNAILQAIARDRHHIILAEMTAAADAAGPGHAARIQAALDARVQCQLRLAREGHHAPQMLHRFCAAVEPVVKEFSVEQQNLLAGLLREGAAAGAFDVDDPQRVAVTVLTAYSSFTPPGIFKISPEAVAEGLAALHRLVLYGLIARPDGKAPTTP